MIIKTVTITGADDSIEPESLIALSREFPFVEWGILLSRSQNDGCRFPSKKWISRLFDLTDDHGLDEQINLSAHICGKWVRELLQGEIFDLVKFMGKSIAMFQRIQINTHAHAHQVNRIFKRVLDDAMDRQIIVQFDGINECLYDLLKGWGIDVRPLFDVSGGAGIVPEEWPRPIDKYSGYAGGLGPDNLKEELHKIESVVGDGTIWIDMETKVRTNSDMIFNLHKVKQCLGIAKDYINN